MTRLQDGKVAEALGAWAIGVLLFSTSPRSVSLQRAKEIFHALPSSTLKVAVSHTTHEDDLTQILALSPDVIQIYHPFVLPKIRPYRVFRVCTGGRVPSDCDAVVLDNSHGSGRPYDADIARRIVAESPVPVILAGGLTSENVAKAIAEVRPFAVDVASGIEVSCGCKDPVLMRKFFAACQERRL